VIKRGGGRDFLVGEQDSPGANEIVWDTDPVYLSEGQYLALELTGCTASDVLRAYLSGWFKEGREVTP
jgi:hypothetical protein